MKKATKLMSMVLCFLMVLSFSVHADVYDMLFSEMKSFSAQMKVNLKCENLDFLNEIGQLSEAQAFLDGELFFGGLFETDADAAMDFAANDDYTDIRLAMQMSMTVPLRLNGNLMVNAQMKLGMWGIYDVTDENNPVIKLALSTPISGKYIFVDAVEELLLSGMEKSEISAKCREFVNKETITACMTKLKEIYKANSSVSQNDNKAVITISEEQFHKLLMQTMSLVIGESRGLISDENIPSPEDISDIYNSLLNMCKISLTSEYTADKNGDISGCDAVVNMAFDVPNGKDETVTIGFEVIESAAYTNVNKEVEVSFPDLDSENSTYYYDVFGGYHEPYYDSVSLCSEYVPAADNSFYVPLGNVLRSIRSASAQYYLSNDNGVITLIDTNNSETFDTASFTVGSSVYEVDGTSYTAPNPVIVKNDNIYVDNTVIAKLFELQISYAETNLIKNTTDAYLWRDRSPEPDKSEELADNWYDEEICDEEHDIEYYENFWNCEHFQNLWLSMDYPDFECNDYFAVRSVIDNYVYSHDAGQRFDISYDNGVVTINCNSDSESLKNAVITVGSNEIFVNGARYLTDLPAVNAGGRIYIDKKAVGALLGFELKRINLVYEVSQDDNTTVTSTIKSADFERKNPSCIHAMEDVDYYSDFYGE